MFSPAMEEFDMSYSPSPRPTFDGPAHIPAAAVTRHLWGDSISGEVADWIYVSSGKIHQLIFGLLPGAMFRHSEEYRTIFGADEVLYVLSGILLINNPETGEVHRALPGEAIFFRRDTWHHAMNGSSEPLRVLELFAPPPSQGTSGAYARTKPYLTEPKYTQDQWIGRWPMAREEATRGFSIQMVRDADILWRLEGRERQVLVGILASTEHLLPGQHTEVQTHGGDESLYLLEGTLHVRLPEHQGARWCELSPGDGFYIPQGEPHQYYNVSDTPVSLLFAVAPTYLPGMRE
jgi:quercetin dioxygenase-like cupin family protein